MEEMEFGWPYLIVSLGFVGFMIDTVIRYKRDSAVILRNQDIEHKKIDAIKKQGEAAQKAIADLKSEIEEMKKERTRLTQDISIAKEKLEEMEGRDKRRGSNRLEED